MAQGMEWPHRKRAARIFAQLRTVRSIAQGLGSRWIVGTVLHNRAPLP